MTNGRSAPKYHSTIFYPNSISNISIGRHHIQLSEDLFSNSSNMCRDKVINSFGTTCHLKSAAWTAQKSIASISVHVIRAMPQPTVRKHPDTPRHRVKIVSSENTEYMWLQACDNFITFALIFILTYYYNDTIRQTAA